jgi:hypothetical protein
MSEMIELTVFLLSPITAFAVMMFGAELRGALSERHAQGKARVDGQFGMVDRRRVQEGESGANLLNGEWNGASAARRRITKRRVATNPPVRGTHETATPSALAGDPAIRFLGPGLRHSRFAQLLIARPQAAALSTALQSARRPLGKEQPEHEDWHQDDRVRRCRSRTD